MQNTGPYRTITTWSSSAIASSIPESRAIAEIAGATGDEVSRITTDAMVKRLVSKRTNPLHTITTNVNRTEMGIPFTRFKPTEPMPLDNVVMPHKWNYNKNIKLSKELKVDRTIPVADLSSSKILEPMAHPQKGVSSIQQRTRNDILSSTAARRIYSNSDTVEQPVSIGRSLSGYVDPGIIAPTTTVKVSPTTVQKAISQPIYPDIGEAINKVMLSGAGTKNKYSNYSRGVNQRIREELSKQ
jgi:hypothetical protein